MHDEPENFPTADTRCWEPKQNICKGNGSVEWGEGGGYALLEDWRISISLCFGAPDVSLQYNYVCTYLVPSEVPFVMGLHGTKHERRVRPERRLETLKGQS